MSLPDHLLDPEDDCCATCGGPVLPAHKHCQECYAEYIDSIMEREEERYYNHQRARFEHD